MDESVLVKTITVQAGTSGNVNHVIIRKNDLIELLKTLDGLKKQLQPLLK